MKKKQVLLAVFAATMLTPTVAWAQYPQISGEAKENYTKMMTEERKRSDEAWEKALPIVQKEAREGRPYIPWAGRPYDLPQADIPSFPGAEGGGMYSFGGRGGKVITVTNLNDRGPGSFREACETMESIIDFMKSSGGTALQTDVKKGISKKLEPYFDDAVHELYQNGKIKTLKDGSRIRLELV